MSTLNLDFTNVSTGFEVLPAGNYSGVITKVELRTNKAKDGQYLNIEWEVRDENDKIKKVWDMCSLKPAALWKLKELMAKLGFEVEGAINLDVEEFVGKTCDFELKIDTYDGKDRNKVEKYLGSGAATSVAETDI